MGEIFVCVISYGWRRCHALFHHENLFVEAKVFWTKTALAMRGGHSGLHR